MTMDLSKILRVSANTPEAVGIFSNESHVLANILEAVPKKGEGDTSRP